MAFSPVIRPFGFFIVLFAMYHGAEYAFLFGQSTAGFLALMTCFFAAAWWIVCRSPGENPAQWGLEPMRFFRKFPLGWGLGLGYAGLAFTLSCLLGSTRIVETPGAGVFIRQTALLSFGTLLSSFSEDIFTRGLIYRFLRGMLQPWLLVLTSAAVYVLNHIYRLGDGWLLLSHLFALGVLLAIPLVRTGNIGATLGIHWGMNTVYQITNNVIHTGNGYSSIPSLAILVALEILLIPAAPAIFRPEKATENKI